MGEHDGVFGRVEIEPHDVPDLLGEHRILGQLEATHDMGLHSEGPPDPAHRSLSDACFACHLAAAPVGEMTRNTFKCLGQDFLDLLVADRAGGATSRGVGEPADAIGSETLPPFADGLYAGTDDRGDLGVVLPLRTEEDDAGPHGVALGRLRTSCDEFKFLAFLGGELYG